MHDETNAHAIKHFLESLNEEQLVTLRRILAMISQREDFGPYYTGLITAQLNSKFGICIACSQKHDEQLEKLVETSDKKKTVVSQLSWTEFVASADEELLDKAAEYNVELSFKIWPKVRCRKCGTEFASLEDRFLRKPDECAGCIQKEKWG